MGRVADALIGFAGGVMGGLSGPLPTLWASVRGWGKNQRRGIFQTFHWTILTTAPLMHIASGAITGEVVRLALVAVPGTVVGAWLGARAYHRLSERNFQIVVLGLLFVSGVSLVVSSLALRRPWA